MAASAPDADADRAPSAARRLSPPGRRYRVRFRKEGNARWISHLDLIRAFERLLRRAGLRLRMSEGFHPKPRMTFPSALAVGIAGIDEVLELELNEEPSEGELLDRLNAVAAPGLSFTSVAARPLGSAKARVVGAEYHAPLPQSLQAAVIERAAALMAEASHVVTRPDSGATVDLRPGIVAVAVNDSELRMRLRVAIDGAVRPREVLAALGLADLEETGATLTRVRVEVADDVASEDAAPTHESADAPGDHEPDC